MEKHGTARQATDDNTAHALCVLGIYIYIYIYREILSFVKICAMSPFSGVNKFPAIHSTTLSDKGEMWSTRSAHNADGHLQVSSIYAPGRQSLRNGRQSNPIYECTARAYGILKVKNALIKPMYYVMESTNCNLRLFVCRCTTHLLKSKTDLKFMNMPILYSILQKYQLPTIFIWSDI